MNRRVLYALALLSLGLMVGLTIGRFFMPARDGIVTMLLLFIGGVCVGALGLRAWSVWRGEQSAKTADKPRELGLRFGTRALTLRWDTLWWENFQARWFGIEKNDSRSARAFWDAHWADVQAPNAGMLLGAFLLVIVAQLLILGSQLTIGLVMYLLAGIAVLFWVWRQDISVFHLVSAARVGRRVEALCLIAILLIAFGARMIQVGEVPVAIDGDELKWTAQAYYDFVSQDKTGDFSGQIKWSPVSFYVDKLAFDWFGVDFNSPRVMTALLSVLATVVFYFVARDMFNVSIALISTLLMATSYYDVNTSRQAIVETFTKLPMILALFLVVRGVDRQKWYYFLLCGIVLYLGVMTYDTFFVVPPAIVLYIIFRGALDWRKFYRWLFYLALVIAPMLLAYPIVADTIAGRQYTYVKGVSSGIQDLLDTNTLAPLLANTAKSFAALFQILQGSDYALDWRGPLVNPLVLPFLVLGFALVLSRFWQRHNLLLILSFLICFFPAPILSGYTVPRVFYVGLPPIFIFAAVGIVGIAAALLSLNRKRVMLARVTTAMAAALLLLIALSDGYIFANELTHQADWKKRRALIETVQTSLETAPLTLLPVTRAPNDYVWGNNAAMKFIAFTANHDKNAGETYRMLPFAELPGALGDVANQFERVNIVFDRAMSQSDERTAKTIETLKRCYGDVQTRADDYFDVYTLEQAALLDPNCYSLTRLEGITPNPDAIVPANRPVTFVWQADSDRPTAFQLQVEQRNPGLIWVEGESFPRENGWAFEAKADHFPDFSGAGYLLDNQGAGDLKGQIEISQGGTYDVWVRYVRPAQDGYASFLKIGDKEFEFARAGVPLGTWNWERIGQVRLAQGQQSLQLTREYGGSDFGWKPILVDAIFLSADPNFDPAKDDLWSNAHQIPQSTLSASQYVLESGLSPGTYRWRVRLLDGAKLVDADGRRGVWSEKVEFRVQ